jgi:tetratricopeptide (TPR) repeat protein
LVDVVAFHYGAAAEIATEMGSIDGVPSDLVGHAVEWLEEAANRAHVAQLLPVAARLFSQALKLVGDEQSPRRARLLLGHAASLTDLRELDRARVDIEAAMEIAAMLGDDSIAAHALLALGDFEQKGGQLDAALATLRSAVERFDALGDMKGRGDALRVLGLTQMFHGANEDAEQSISDALDAYRSLDDRRGQAWALQNLAWISYIRGRASEAEERLRESAAMFTELADSGGLTWVLGLMAFVKYHQGQFAEAEDVGEQVLVEARQRGDRWGEGMMLLLMAGVRLWSGRTRAAVTAARDALRVFRAIGDRFAEAQALAFLGRAEIAAGDVSDGLHLLEEAFDGFREAPQLEELREVLAGALAGAAAQIGAPELVFKALANCDFDKLSSHGIGDVDLLVARGIALTQQGQTDRAIDALLPVVEPDEGVPSPYAVAALALAYAVAGSSIEGERHAAAVLADGRATYSDRTLANLARALLAARSPAADGDDGSRYAAVAQVLEEIAGELRGVEDQVTQTIVTLARAAIGDATGDPGAAAIAARAELQLAALGIDGEGWRHLFSVALEPL